MGLSNREMGRRLGPYHKTVGSFLMDTNAYACLKSPERPKTLSEIKNFINFQAAANSTKRSRRLFLRRIFCIWKIKIGLS